MPTAGTYRLHFANRFTIEQKRRASTGGVTTTVTVADPAATCRRGTEPTAASCVLTSNAYTVGQVVPVSAASPSVMPAQRGAKSQPLPTAGGGRGGAP